MPHLFKEAKLPHPMFSLCFSAGGGSMTLGTPETEKHTSEVVVAKLQESSGQYEHYLYALLLSHVYLVGMQ